MHRRRILNLLADYRAARTSERACVDRIVEFVERVPSCFERSTKEGHITGSSWILDHEKRRCLLTHHKKLGVWLQVGGHADGDPDPLNVAKREALEESGIEGLVPMSEGIFDVDVHLIPARPSEPAHFHYDIRFAFVAPEGAAFTVSDESHDLAWVERGDLARYTSDASVLRMGEKWRI